MDNCALRSVLDLPAPFHSVFSFRYFNSLQSECFSACFLSDMNMVISAPTGSGKTALFELCILRVFSKFISRDGSFIPLKGIMKTVYIAPSKALVQEKLRDWNQKFRRLGVNCLELTGDNENYSMRNIQEADMILTTPEKFDAVTRYRAKDGGLSFFGDIALVLLDEVHLLNDPRGAALEAIVSRLKMLACKYEMKSSSLAQVRFLAISATIPNIDDLAEWLMVPYHGIKRFGEEMRPVKLTTKVLGYTPAKNDFLFEKRLQNYVFDILMQYSRGKSALVFCSTRKGAQEAAQQLAQTAMTFGHSNPFMKSAEQQERLRDASLSCGDKQMQSYILYGVGYHNGGLSLKDRNLIESLFLNADLQVLCTTNTLALGINLPAHTVVIKSTQYFNKEKGIYLEYDRSMIQQMCGRAGRPPFDDTGMVILMTRRETVHLYENLLNGCEMVESQMLPCLTEHLTAEIVQLSISDITRAIEWMKCSFLYVRMKKNPENYSVKNALHGNLIEKHIQEICVQKITELSYYQMIWTDEDGFLLKPLEPGVLMTKYYLKFDTVKHIMQTPANCSIEDALRTICRAEEISWIQLRRNEKKLLNDLNLDKDGRLRFHILADKGRKKKRIQTREEKIFILANDCLTGDPLVRDLSMSQDMNFICTNGCRVAKCMKEYFIHKKIYKGALNSALLAKSLHQKLWDGSPYLLKQLPGIGMVTAKALHSMGVNSFETLLDADPRKIEIVTGRKFPFGNHIKESLSSLPPKVEMKFVENVYQKQGKSKLGIILTRLSQPTASTKRHYAEMVVSIEEENIILFHERISPYCATVLLPAPHHGKLTVTADLLFEEFIGVDIRQSTTIGKDVDLANHKMGSKNPPTSRQIGTSITKDVANHNNASDKAQLGACCISNESKALQDNLPSFKLIDEELEEDLPVPSVHEAPAEEMEDDDCMVLTDKSVFDHIREKAKNLPALALSSSDNTCSPSLETLTFIRKRMRDRHLEPNDAEVPDENPKIKVLCQNMVTRDDGEVVDQDPFFKDSLGKFTVSNTDELLQLLEGRPVPEHLTEGTIFDHIRRKAKTFPAPGSLNTNKSGISDLKPQGITEAHCQKQFPEDSSLRTSSGPVPGVMEFEDLMFDWNSLDSSYGVTVPRENVPNCQEPAPRNLSVHRKQVKLPATWAERSHHQPSSPALQHRQYSSYSTKEDIIREQNSFHGYKTIFSFL